VLDSEWSPIPFRRDENNRKCRNMILPESSQHYSRVKRTSTTESSDVDEIDDLNLNDLWTFFIWWSRWSVISQLAMSKQKTAKNTSCYWLINSFCLTLQNVKTTLDKKMRVWRPLAPFYFIRIYLFSFIVPASGNSAPNFSFHAIPVELKKRRRTGARFTNV
jgi:hypothetical protein